MDGTEQNAGCSEKAAYHEIGHALVGVVLGRQLRIIRCDGEDGATEFEAGRSINSDSDLLVVNVAGLVAEDLLTRQEKNNQGFGSIPSANDSHSLVSHLVEMNHWKGNRDAEEALKNASKIRSQPGIQWSERDEPCAEGLSSILHELRSAESRAERILCRRWKSVQLIARELRFYGWIVSDTVRKYMGLAGTKRAFDE